MNRQQKRNQMKKLKKLTPKQFWEAQDLLHTRAYAVAVQHYTEAAEIVLPPRLQKQLHDKATEIREVWDGMATVTTDKTIAEVLTPREGQSE